MDPSAPTDRRQFLGTAGTIVAGVTSALAGCAGLDLVGHDPGVGPGRLAVGITNEDEVPHVVSVTVTDDAGTVVEDVPPVEIAPGTGRTFTSDGFARDTYMVSVSGQGRTSWRNAIRWDDLDTCPSLSFDLRIRYVDGVQAVEPSPECASP